MFDEDYQQLEELLKVENWPPADELTLKILLKLANQDTVANLDILAIAHLPCEQLRTIDRFWVKYSGGRYGFSVQRRIWERAGGKSDVHDIAWTDLGWCVGWCGDHRQWLPSTELGISPFAPVGHFPMLSPGNLGVELAAAKDIFTAIFLRLEECKKS